MPTVCSTMTDRSCTNMIRRLRRALHSLLIASGISRISSSNAETSRRSLNCSGFRGRPVSGWNVSTPEQSSKPQSSSRLPLRISHYDNRFLALQIHDPNTNATWIVNCKDASEVFKTVTQALDGETDKAPDFFVSPRRR